jgi:cobalt-zinc-cadmium efflux system membrane fusion protein
MTALGLTLALLPGLGMSAEGEHGHDGSHQGNHEAGTSDHQGHDDSGHKGGDHSDGHQQHQGQKPKHSGGHEPGGHKSDGKGAIHLNEAKRQEFDIAVREAASGTVPQTQQLPGEIAFRPDSVAHVDARVTGVTKKVLREPGDQVKAGETLAVLTSRELGEAQSEYLAARARFQLERATWQRKKRLNNKGITSEAEMLEARNAYREARLNRELARRRLRAMGVSQDRINALPDAGDEGLTRYTIEAPISGTITARHLKPGARVTMNRPEPLFVIADTEIVWAHIAVYPENLDRIETGQEARIRANNTGAEGEGIISYVTPDLDKASRTATARVILDNKDGAWRPGQFITADVTIGKQKADVVVPQTAIQMIDGQPSVFVRTDHGFKHRRVELGNRGDGQVAIQDGLKVGEAFAATNTFTLKAQLNSATLKEAGHAH